ncbi:hypothetical protein J831_4113, partial [Acinetobacter baumannii 25691_8]
MIHALPDYYVAQQLQVVHKTKHVFLAHFLVLIFH